MLLSYGSTTTSTTFGEVQQNIPSVQSLDVRQIKLQDLFNKYKCPQISYDLIPKYIEVADKYDLPYSLLPSISIQESSCGRYYRFKNIYGWNSARTGFNSFEEGLEYVASQLSEGHYYKGKSIEAKLHAYNPNPEYAPKIKGLMKQTDE